MNINDKDAVELHAYAVSNVDYSGNDRDSQAKLDSGRQELRAVVMHNRSDIVVVYVDSSDCLVDERSWSSKCYFPLVADDLLLYLAVISC